MKFYNMSKVKYSFVSNPKIKCCDRSADCAIDLIALNSGLGPLTQAEWEEDLADHELPGKKLFVYYYKMNSFCLKYIITRDRR